MSASDKNISTEYQPPGSAKNPSDTLDRHDEEVPAGQRQWANDSADKPDTSTNEQPAENLQNASARRGGEAAGGLAPHPEDPTSPVATAARGRARDEKMQASGMGDDGSRSTYKS